MELAELKRDLMERDEQLEKVRTDAERQRKEYDDALEQARESVGFSAGECATLKNNVQQLEVAKARSVSRERRNQPRPPGPPRSQVLFQHRGEFPRPGYKRSWRRSSRRTPSARRRWALGFLL